MSEYEVMRRMALTYAVITTVGPASGLAIFLFGVFLK